MPLYLPNFTKAFKITLCAILIPTFCQTSLSSNNPEQIAILWAYKNLKEAKQHTNPKNKKQIGVWSVPHEGKWRALIFFQGAFLNQELAREYHLLKIQKDLDLLKDSPLSEKSKSRLQKRLTAEKRNIKNFYYIADFYPADKIQTLGNILELDKTISQLEKSN